MFPKAQDGHPVTVTLVHVSRDTPGTPEAPPVTYTPLELVRGEKLGEQPDTAVEHLMTIVPQDRRKKYLRIDLILSHHV